MTWTKKTEQFARSCELRPSTKELAPYLLRRADRFQPTEVLLDLREWNSEIAKDRPKGEYDRKTVKEALTQLDEKTYGWFSVVKTYNWAIHKVLVRPVQYALDRKSQSLGMTPKLKTGNPMFSEDHKKRAEDLLLQNISKLDSLLRKIGIKCNQETLMRMWRYSGKSISNVRNAVEYMLRCHAEKLIRGESVDGEPPKGITSPKGWLHDCLKYGRHQNSEESELPYILNLDAIPGFIRDIWPPNIAPS